MGTILARRRKQGGTAYMAKIILKKNRVVIHRESRTFETHKRAKDWLRDREAELAKTGKTGNQPSATLADAIERYTRDSRKKIGRTKEQVLNAVLASRIAAKRCEDIKSADLIEYAQELVRSRKPQTVANYMSHLQAVFAVAKPAWGYALDISQIKDAHLVCRRMGITAKSGQRDRRPTLDELDRIMAHFEDRSTRRPGSGTHDAYRGVRHLLDAAAGRDYADIMGRSGRGE